jgi:hypothetical protein
MLPEVSTVTMICLWSEKSDASSWPVAPEQDRRKAATQATETEIPKGRNAWCDNALIVPQP